MEKKTIGKFISALRRANGMTQKELGERLFVSDKTVSRWECDECTPELSLIPVIAEIFNVTTDELLRGERNAMQSAQSIDSSQKQSARGEKQFKAMLYNRLRKFKNLTLISVGISILGLIACAIANLGFSNALIGFCLACAFFIAGEICQICFTFNARLVQDNEDDTYTEALRQANTDVARQAVAVSCINIALFAFCLPLVTLINGANYGITFSYWLPYGLLFALVGLVIAYVIYTLFIHDILVRREIIFPSEAKLGEAKAKKRLVKRLSIVSLSVALALLIILIVISEILGASKIAKKEIFYTPEEFKAYVEEQYDKWVSEGCKYYEYDKNGIVIEHVPTDPDYTYPSKETGEIVDGEGNVICEYYYNPRLYYSISFNYASENRMPVTVITQESIVTARNILSSTESICTCLIALDFAVCVAVYLIFEIKKRNSKSNS